MKDQIHLLMNKCLQHLQIKTRKDNLLSRLKITDTKMTKNNLAHLVILVFIQFEIKLQFLLAGLYLIQSGRWSRVLAAEEKCWAAHGSSHCYRMSWTCFVSQHCRTSQFESTVLLLPTFTALQTGNTSCHFIKTKFYGDFFLSYMWVAKRYPSLTMIFHNSVINAVNNPSAFLKQFLNS